MSPSSTSAASPFVPSDTILQRYAAVFTHFGLHGGAGIRPGETVRLLLPEFALPLYLPLQAAILKAGGNLVLDFKPNGSDRQLLEWGNDQQICFFLTEALRVSRDGRRSGDDPTGVLGADYLGLFSG